jgi:ATP-dependent Clp protease, protease subunit
MKIPIAWSKPVRFSPVISHLPSPNFGDPVAFVPICRPSNRPAEAKLALERMGVKDVSLENRLEVRTVVNSAGGKEHTITLIGAIGKSWWDDTGITEQEIRDALKDIPTGEFITFLLNSEGGSVKEGLGIYNAFDERKKDIQVRITGYALSIASVFPLAAKKSLGGRGVISPKSAIWMEHEAWSWAQGNKRDMRHAADMLETHDETLVDIYAKATGHTKDQVRARMEKETWTKGSDAVAAGLADETDPEEDQSQAAYRPLHPDYIARCKNLTPEILNALRPPENGGANQKPAVTPSADRQNTDNIVTRQQYLALLNSWGLDIKDDASVTDARLAELVAMGKTAAVAAHKGTAGAAATTPAPAAAAQPANVIDANAEIKAMKRRLIRAEVVRLGANKIENANVDRWVTRAESEGEEAIYAEITAMQEVNAGASAVSFASIGYGDEPREHGVRQGLTGLRGPQCEMLANIRKEHKTPKARHAAMTEVYDHALEQALAKDMKTGRGRDVFGANTYSGTLVTSFLMDGSLTDLQNVWAMLAAFTVAYNTDPYKPLAVGVLKHVTGGEATQTDPTNFEPADGSTVAPISVTPHWYNQPMRVGPTDLNNGLRMEDLRVKNLSIFADKIVQVATAPITAANFPTLTPEIVSAAAFNWSNSSNMRAQLKKSPIKNLILDGDYLARLENVPSFFQNTGIGNGSRQTFGWTGMYESTNWTGAGANIRGIGCHPQALIKAMGLPLNPPNIPGGIFSTTTFEVPGPNVAVAMSMWFSTASRTMFVSWDVIAGFAAGDGSAAVILASGNPG